MFDIGFWELSLIAIIGLMVLGPERLPAVARVIGGYLRKARQTWASVRAEISAELNAAELRKAVEEPVEEVREAMREPVDDLKDMHRQTQQRVEFPDAETADPSERDPDSP